MTNIDCLFCKFVSGELPVNAVYETDYALAFNDINPQAPTHVLVIPKQHVVSVADVDNDEIYGHVMTVVRDTAKHLGLSDYRVVMNTGAEAGQSVFHWHCHVLAGRPFQWPPG